MNSFRFALGAALIGSATIAQANTSFFTAPSFRGGSYSTYTGWESFTVAVGAPGNKGDLAGSWNNASLIQTDPLAAIIGSGNLYNQNGKSVFEVKYDNISGLPIRDVVLQVRAVGTELNYDSFKLSYGATSLTGVRTELERVGFGPPPGTPGSGVSVSSRIQWSLTDEPTGPLSIQFEAADVSVSFDAGMLDVGLVPEPSTWALFGAGAAALILAERRRRH